VLGADIAGTVESTGKRVTRFKPGDEVFGDLWENWGGFAEYACAHENALEAKPQGLTFEQAACVPQAGVLALQGVRKADPLKPGQRVLINGAGGGVGSFAVQLAKLAGTEVTGVDAAHKLDVIEAIGAEHTIDYTQNDFTQSAERYDLIVDCQCNRPVSHYKRVLSPNGVFAMIGGTSIIAVLMQKYIARLSGETRRFCLVAEGPNKGLSDLKLLLEGKKITPIIDSVYDFDKIPEAFSRFGEGLHIGKIVITMNNT
jgi:NADPH:quinone reductase-like Zn-dependent oxidoreductase